MKRSLFQLLALTSFVLLLASAGMWIRSSYFNDIISGDLSNEDGSFAGHYHIFSESGYLQAGIVTITDPPPNLSIPRKPLVHWVLVIPADLPSVDHEMHLHFSSQTSDISVRSYNGRWARPEDVGSWQGSSAIMILPGKSLRFGIKYWLCVVLFAISPLLWIWRWRKRRALQRIGFCYSCGHDLRATPEFVRNVGGWRRNSRQRYAAKKSFEEMGNILTNCQIALVFSGFPAIWRC
jgi:hypothetical protein